MKRFFIVLLLLLIAVAAAGGYFYWQTQQPYRGYSSAEQFVEIPQGANTRSIGDLLVSSGVVRDQETYRLALWLSGRARALKAGEYRFDQAMTPLDVIAKLARGDVYVIRVTFPEGLTINEMASIFESHGFGA